MLLRNSLVETKAFVGFSVQLLLVPVTGQVCGVVAMEPRMWAAEWTASEERREGGGVLVSCQKNPVEQSGDGRGSWGGWWGKRWTLKPVDC